MNPVASVSPEQIARNKARLGLAPNQVLDLEGLRLSPIIHPFMSEDGRWWSNARLADEANKVESWKPRIAGTM